jgi:hypothetical protein
MLGSYAVLSYFKILELQYEGRGIANWIGDNLAAIALSPDDPSFRHFITACGRETPADYLYKACRVAVAHVSDKHPSDVDETGETTRLYSAARVLRRLARRFISKELGASENVNSGD